MLAGMSTPTIACPQCHAKNRVPLSASGKPRCGKCQANLPWLVSATDSNLPAALDTSMLVVLDLWAPWCGPCRMIAPVLESLSRRYAGRLKVVKVNVDDNPKAAARYNARSIPLLLLIRKGQIVDKIVGAQPESVFASKIDAQLGGK